MKIAIQLLSGGIVNRGAEHSMLMLAEDLVSLGHQVTVFQAGPEGKKAAYKTVSVKLPLTPTSYRPKTIIGKVLERLYLDKRSLLSLLFSLRVKKHLKSFDIIIPTDGYWSVKIAKQAKALHAKIVCVGLAGLGWTDADTIKLHPDHFVALSNTAKEWAKTIDAAVSTSVIPLQVDCDTFQNSPKLPISLTAPIVLTVAALTKYKRVDAVIKAVAAIPNVILLIIGQGEEQEYITALCEAALPKRYLIKTVSFEELPAIYKSADVFTLLSDQQEAFGQVLVEAMAAQLPIVTTDSPIRREIVGNKGIFVNPQDGAQVAQAIIKALTIKSINYDIKRFDRRVIAKQYETLFTKLHP
jgi:glycosyltransferase involved in cell wall biosynthesis